MHKFVIPMLALLFFIVACSFSFRPIVSKEALRNTNSENINLSILLDIKDEFKGFVDSGFYRDNNIPYNFYFGEATAGVFNCFMESIFVSVKIRSSNDNSTAYDYVATPIFVNTISKPYDIFEISTTIEVEFMSRDKKRVVRVTGEGSERGLYRGGVFQERFGETALNEAIVNLRRNIYINRDNLQTNK